MTSAIDIQGLTRRFDTITAVDQMHLTVRPGEMFGLVGPDGAGKTTLFRMLTGILRPSEGTATILGRDLIRSTDEIKKDIGYLSQRFTLYGDLTVDENIEFFAEINDIHDFHDRREELLTFTRLTPFRSRLAEQLSGGMKQKLALACTLIHRPRIIFLDEPTTGVDPVSRRDFWKILSSLLHEDITIVMSTPYLDEAERCGRVALIDQGKVMVVDTPARLKEAMPGEVVEIISDQVRRAAGVLRGIPGLQDVQAFGDRLNIVVTDSTRQMPSIQAALDAAEIRVTEWRRVPASLENIFIAQMAKSSQR